MARKNNARFWTVRISYRYVDISFQFTDAEEAAIFAQNALDNFAPHYSDYYVGSSPKMGIRIDLISAEENEQKMQEYLEQTTPKENAEE